MKLNIVLVAFCVALVGGVWFSMTPTTHAEGVEGVVVSATAYTCEVHPRNPMSGCRRLRWGGNVNNPGMACPVSWRDREFVVEGYGTLRCDDTGRYDTWNGLPHIDIRFATWEETRAWGVRKITIYPAGSQPEAAVAAAPSTTTTAQSQNAPGMLAVAKKAVPTGDATTAVVRTVTADVALAPMPWLNEIAPLSGNQPIVLVTLWQPRDILPADATGLPNRNEPIATTLVILDGNTGAVLGQSHVTMEGLNAIGALPH